MSVKRNLAALPKGHLHIHLEGAMRPETLEELAAAHGVDVPPVRDFAGFGAFLGRYDAACRVLKGENDMRRLVREVVEDAARDGAVWIEPTFYPGRHPETLEATVGLVLDELAAAGHELGVGTGLILSAVRTESPEEAERFARLAARFAPAGIVGFGLAGDEQGHPPEPFAAAFAIARDAGLLSVPHGGELAGPESVAGCLDALHADRVAHGVRAVEDPALVARLASAGICLDVCPSSNLVLGVVPTMEMHPLASLLEAGVRCSLNADDPLLFGPGLGDEYRLAREVLGLSDDTLAGIARSSLTSSGAPREVVADGLARIQAWLGDAPLVRPKR